MHKMISTACAALMALSMPFATGASAMPMNAPGWNHSNVIQAQADGGSPNISPGNRGGRWDRGGGWDRGGRNWDRGGRNWNRDRNWRRGGYERRGGHAYYRGHRGYREYRPGYRRHGDFWFPPAAFIAGAIIGGAIANQPPAYRGGDAHTEWCYARYRSYRASDNTFQPYNGPRRQCNSPYG